MFIPANGLFFFDGMIDNAAVMVEIANKNGGQAMAFRDDHDHDRWLEVEIQKVDEKSYLVIYRLFEDGHQEAGDQAIFPRYMVQGAIIAFVNDVFPVEE